MVLTKGVNGNRYLIGSTETSIVYGALDDRCLLCEIKLQKSGIYFGFNED
jgi:hypothetical protein